MKLIAFGLLKLTLIFLLLAVAVEVALANYKSPTREDWLHTSCASVAKSTEDIFTLRLEELWLVSKASWVFHNKVHYLVLTLITLIIYYSYCEKHLPHPDISLSSARVDDYEREKRENTQREVEKLRNSKKYQDYIFKKVREAQLGKKEEEEDMGEWEEAERQIFDD